MTQAKMSPHAKWTLGVMAVVILALLLAVVNAPEVDLSGYISNEDSLEAQNTAVKEALIDKDNEILSLQTELDSLSEEEQEVVELGYLVDKLFLGAPFEIDTYSDRELNLFDGEVDFDGEDYDAEETLVLQYIELLANERDYDGNVYMTIPEGAVAYKLEFDSELNTSLIGEDETLVFNFLGNELEVSNWDVNSLVFTQGEEYYLTEGDSVDFDGKVIVLDMVLGNAVYVTVDGVGKKIVEYTTRAVNGLEIHVKEVLYTEKSGRESKAMLIIGKDVKLTVSDGEEYEEDSAWEWVIDSNSIGLVLVEDFTEVDADGDEEFQAVGTGDSLCLPNNYVCIQFNGISEEDEEEYSFRLDEREGFDFVRVDGNFLSGLEDYNRVYVNDTGIYDRDLELIDSNEVELGDSDVVLVRSTEWITIEDFKVNYDLNVSEANRDVLSDDEDYLSEYGISIVNPEDSAEDNEYSIAVPREQIEGSFSLLM